MNQRLSVEIGVQVADIAVLKILDKNEEADATRFELFEFVSQLGYEFGKSSYLDESIQIPCFLAYYPELEEDWNYGFSNGYETAETKSCFECQSNDIEMCMIHDR